MAKKKYFTDESLQTLVDETKGYVDENIADLQNATISLKNGTNIPTNSDLNTYIEIGNFKCTSKSIVATFLNCPTKQSFKMIVENTVLFQGDYRTQTIIDVNGDIYTRYTWDMGVNWTEWKNFFNNESYIPTINGGIGVDTTVDLDPEEHTRCINKFVEEMNRTASVVGMTNSTFNTPYGSNDYITAYDLLRLLIAAKHTPTVFKAMSTVTSKAKINGEDNTISHIILNTSKWKDWAAANGYTLIAAKGGSVTGNYGKIGQTGISNIAILLQDSNGDTYALSIVGLQNPTDWKNTISYNEFERVEYDGKTYMSLVSSNLNNTPTNTSYWLEVPTEIDVIRTLCHDTIQFINGFEESEAMLNAINCVDRKSPVSICGVKLPVNGSFLEDIEALDNNGVFYNEDIIRFAASVTKIMTAIVSTQYLENHYCSVVSNELVGGSGYAFNKGDIVTTYDALYMMLLLSDNAMAMLLARVCGTKNLDAFEGGKVNGFTSFQGGYGRGTTATKNGITLIDSPADGVLFVPTSTSSGILKIILPQDFVNTFIKFDLAINSQSKQLITTYSFAGQIYKRSSDGTIQWAFKAYDINGTGANATLNNLQINFGRHNEKAAISIGNANTVWGYSMFAIKNIQASFANYTEDLWSSGWNIILDSNPLDEILNTYDNPISRVRENIGATSVTIKRWEETD